MTTLEWLNSEREKLQILLDFWNDPKVNNYELVGRTTLSKQDITNWLEASIETIDIEIADEEAKEGEFERWLDFNLGDAQRQKRSSNAGP